MSETAAQPVKSKAQLRAERRAIQEAQRAAKKEGADKSKHIIKKQSTEPSVSSGFQQKANIKKNSDSSIKAKSQLTDSKEKTNLPKRILDPPTDDGIKVAGNDPFILPRKQEVCRVHLFRHLKEPDKRQDVIGGLGLGSHSAIHPVFLALGVNYDEGRIWGSNERCLHLLSACESLIKTYQPHSWTSASESQPAVDSSMFARNFGPILERHMQFLNLCRSTAITMSNAYSYLKGKLNLLDSVDDWEECRTQLLTAIDEFRQTSIFLAGTAISELASSSIRPGECICTFGYCPLVARVLERAWLGPSKSSDPRETEHLSSLKSTDAVSDSKSSSPTNSVPLRFSVVVVDARPRFEGRKMLARLVKLGIPCEYTHIAALPALAHKVSLAIVGAQALLNNGYVVSRMGTAQVATVISAIAHAPTLVCAETYKFSERAHSDAFEWNELGDPDDIWRGPRGHSSDPEQGLPGCGPTGIPTERVTADISQWRTNPKLRLLHLQYDVLPPELVTAVVTEKGTLPTTSVPVVLRVKQETAPIV